MGVIVGYLTMALGVFVLLTVAYVSLGETGAFVSGTYDVTTMWIGTSFVLGFAAAVLGGYVAGTIGQHERAVEALLVVVMVLGAVAAIGVVLSREPSRGAGRAGAGSSIEAMQRAKQPIWVALLNPVVGACGVWIGGRLRFGR